MKKYLLAEDTIDKADIQDLIGWLQTHPWLTQGPLVKEFERAWADWLGVSYAAFVNSGSSANLLMVYSLLLSGRLKNKKIVVPAVAWSTTVAPAIQLGLEPLMCDAEEQTFGLDPDALEEILKKENPAAVIGVHILGVPMLMNRILGLQAKYGFILLEDACAATGSSYAVRRVGTFGLASTFSFFFGHHISTIEGGMVCTSDESLYEIILQIRGHGWAKDLPPARQVAKAKSAGIEDFNRPCAFYYPGFNVRSTDLNAKIGLGQMRKLERVIQRRIENHKIYQKNFADVPGLQVQSNPEAEICSIAFAVLADSSDQRDSIAENLKRKGIETRPLGGGNMSHQPFWAERFGSRKFPVADRIQGTCFQLPNHPALYFEDIQFIANTVKKPLADIKGDSFSYKQDVKEKTNASFENPAQFSAYADQLFQGLIPSVRPVRSWRLLQECQLPPEGFKKVQCKTASYVGACFGQRQRDWDEEDFLKQLSLHRPGLFNLTPNGMLCPKREVAKEFHDLHQAVASALKNFDLSGVLESIHIPVNVRIVSGYQDLERDGRAYATNLWHSDVWAGEPLDAVVIHIPVFGDTERLGIDFAEMDPSEELEKMQVYPDYRSAGQEMLLKEYSLDQMVKGRIYFADPRLIHRTRRWSPGLRVSLDFRFRLRVPLEYRNMTNQRMAPERLPNYISWEAFQSLGLNKQMIFKESMEEARTRSTQAASQARHPVSFTVEEKV